MSASVLGGAGIGSTVGGAAGSVIGGPLGGTIGGVIGSKIDGLLGGEEGTRPYGAEPNYWNYPGYLPPGQRHKGYVGPSRANWQAGIWKPTGAAKGLGSLPFSGGPGFPPPPPGKPSVLDYNAGDGIGPLGLVVIIGAVFGLARISK